MGLATSADAQGNFTVNGIPSSLEKLPDAQMEYEKKTTGYRDRKIAEAFTPLLSGEIPISKENSEHIELGLTPRLIAGRVRLKLTGDDLDMVKTLNGPGYVFLT